MPFDDVPTSFMKERVIDQHQRAWDNNVWLAGGFFDLPGAATVQRVARFPYIDDLAKSFQTSNSTRPGCS